MYNVRKGWPSNAAIDEVLKADTGATITDGMIVKVRAALDAAQTLGRPVDIASWRYPELLPALFDGEAIGTRISAES